MSKLVNCETCDKLVVDTSLNTIHTSNKGDMKVCKKCYDGHNEAIKTSITEANRPEIKDNQVAISHPDGSISVQPKTDPAVISYLKSYGHVSNPESVPSVDIPETSSKKLSQEQLFAEYLRDEQVKIADIFDETKPGYDAGIAYKQLEARIELMQGIVFQSKVRASELTKKQRELDAASGKNRWDKERRGENRSNNSDPRTNPLLSKAQKDKKADLSKAEKQVKGLIDIGTEDEDILTMLTSTGKFKGSEIREAIEKFRKG